MRVQLASTKLLFPDGADQQIVLPEGVSTQQFAVEARASGTFTMTATLTTGDGAVRLGIPQRVSVRSAVFNGAGAALTVGRAPLPRAVVGEPLPAHSSRAARGRVVSTRIS